jgi:hypothetical protein
VVEPYPGACERAFVRDLIARERNAVRTIRERQLDRVGRDHDHDVAARVEERAQRAVEERCVVDGLDDLRPPEPPRRAAREQDSRGPAHPREISTTAL